MLPLNPVSMVTTDPRGDVRHRRRYAGVVPAVITSGS